MKKICFLLLLQLNSYLLLSQTDNFMFERAVPFVIDNKWGWADVYTNKILIEPKYDSVDFDYRGSLMVFKNGKVGIAKCLYGNNCFEIISTEYDEITSNRFGYITAINNKKGYVNLKYKKIIDNLYDSISFYDNHVFLINKEKYKSGVFDIDTDELIIPFDYEIIPIGYSELESHYKGFLENALIKYYVFLDKNGKYYFLNINRELQEIKLKDNSLWEKITRSEQRIPKPEELYREFTLEGGRNFRYGHKDKGAKFKIGKVKLFNSNEYFDDYLIVQNKKKNKYGLINTKSDKIILNPEYAEIQIMHRKSDFYFIAIKNYKKTLLFKDKRISENEYDEIKYDMGRDIIILKKNGLYGIVFINRKRFYNEEEKVSFVVFEPKFTRYNFYKHTYGKAGISVISVTNNENENYYISNLGFEYKK